MSPMKLSHVVFQTNHKARMRDWYCALLGAHVVFENEPLCFIAFDHEHHRVAFVDKTALTPRTANTATLHHVAFGFDSLDALLLKYVELRDKQIRPVAKTQHGMTTSLYYRDPDGNLAELMIENFATPEQATAYMNGAEFSATAGTGGVPFNPEAMLEARRGGVGPAELTTLAWARASAHQVGN